MNHNDELDHKEKAAGLFDDWLHGDFELLVEPADELHLEDQVGQVDQGDDPVHRLDLFFLHAQAPDKEPDSHENYENAPIDYDAPLLEALHFLLSAPSCRVSVKHEDQLHCIAGHRLQREHQGRRAESHVSVEGVILHAAEVGVE